MHFSSCGRLTIKGAGTLFVSNNKVLTAAAMYTAISTGNLTDCVIAVMAIRLAAVTVTPFRKYLIRENLRTDLHNGNIKKTRRIPGRKILKPPIKPAANENPVPLNDLDETNAAKLKSGPGMA